MRHVVLQFWLSLDGYSCDEDTELCRLMEEIEDPLERSRPVDRARGAGWSAVRLRVLPIL
jgi:hypothetical protein